MKIKRGGVRRNCTKEKYRNKFKRLGYEIVESETDKKEMINIEQYHTGYGWYEYEGKSYRKTELKKKLGVN